MSVDRAAFEIYANEVKQQMDKLARFELPKPLVWKINWEELKGVFMKGNEKTRTNNWSSLPLYKELLNHRTRPAIYCFYIDPLVANDLYNAYYLNRDRSAQIRKSKGVRDPDFRNICHVPKIYNESNCLYVGSVKKDIHSRLRQHLGGEKSGRTGALYLKDVIRELTVIPQVEYRAYILDKDYLKLTEHIETVLQNSLKPILGKKAFKD